MSQGRMSLAILVAIVALHLTPAFAQQPAPAAPAAPLAAPVPASHLQAARELIISSGTIRSFEGLLPGVVAQVRQTITRQRPELIKDLEQVLAQLTPEIETERDEILTIAARVYASRLTEQELKDANIFFKSAAGQKFVNMQPLIFDELFGEMQTWMARVVDKTMDRVRVEMKKKGHDL